MQNRNDTYNRMMAIKITCAYGAVSGLLFSAFSMVFTSFILLSKTTESQGTATPTLLHSLRIAGSQRSIPLLHYTLQKGSDRFHVIGNRLPVGLHYSSLCISGTTLTQSRRHIATETTPFQLRLDDRVKLLQPRVPLQIGNVQSLLQVENPIPRLQAPTPHSSPP